MSFTKNLIFTLANRILLMSIGLLSGILIARSYGVHGNAIYAFAVLLVTSGIQFGCLGMQNSITYYIVQKPDIIRNLSGIAIWISLIWGTTISCVIYALLALGPDYIPQQFSHTLLFITLFSIPFNLFSFFFQNILIAKNLVATYNLTLFLNRVVLLALISALVFVFHAPLENVIIGVAAISVFDAIICAYILHKRHLIDYRWNPEIFEHCLGFGLYNFFVANITNLIFQANIFLVFKFLDLKDAGYYSLAVTISSYLMIFPQIVSMLMVPRVVENLNERTFTEKVLRLNFVVLLFTSFTAIIFAKPVILTLYGAEFDGSLASLYILLPGMFFWALSSILMNYFTLNRNIKFTLISPIVLLALNVALNVVLTPRYGIIATAYIATGTYLLTFITNVSYFIIHYRSHLRNVTIPRREDVLNLLNLFSVWRKELQEKKI